MTANILQKNEFSYSLDSEPADPPESQIDHDSRRAVQLGLASDVADMPKPLVTCGCGDCPAIVDPLCDVGKSVRSDFWAKSECGNPRPMTVERTREAYLTYQRASEGADDRTALHERHRREVYPQILAGDRHMRKQYEWLTTVLLTRRVDPKGVDGEWLPPLYLDKLLHNSELMKQVREKLRYQLKTSSELEFEYVRVTATTWSAATPHEHRLLYVNDPDNVVSMEHIKPALEAHLKHCPGAYEKDHPTDSQGAEGAITIRHDPPLVSEKLTRGNDIRHTQAAQYLASQLPHLPLWDKFDSAKTDPKDTFLEGGAIAWASPHKWFYPSQGIPKLED